MIRLGFHLSIAGDISNPPKLAKELGYGAFQIFSSNPRAWATKILDNESAESFKAELKSSRATPFAHTPYLCNLASPDKDTYAKSISMLERNISNCEILGIKYLVLHIGSHVGSGAENGIKRIIDGLNLIEKNSNVNILLENSAGYRNSLGSHFEEVGNIIESVNSNKLGICLDTCHAFAAGYDIKDQKALESMVNEIDSHIGFKRLGLVHLNDSKFPVGSGLDRHWHIGKGYIGESGFIEFFKERHFRDGSFIMETPYYPNSDKDNLDAARKLIGIALDYKTTATAKTA